MTDGTHDQQTKGGESLWAEETTDERGAPAGSAPTPQPGQDSAPSGGVTRDALAREVYVAMVWAMGARVRAQLMPKAEGVADAILARLHSARESEEERSNGSVKRPNPAPDENGCWYGVERCALPHCDCNERSDARLPQPDAPARPGADGLGEAAKGSFDAAVHVPGAWRCAKCGFSLLQSTLNANSGAVTARDVPGESCPNDGSPLWRVTWREYAEEANAMAEQAFETGKARGLEIAALSANPQPGHEVREALRDAYIQGCEGTHNAIQAEPELAQMAVENAEFGEAADDYAASVALAAKPQPADARPEPTTDGDAILNEILWVAKGNYRDCTVRLDQDTARDLIAALAQPADGALRAALEATTRALAPFAEASNELHPSHASDATTLDGIEVRAWHTARGAHRHGLAALAASPAPRPSDTDVDRLVTLLKSTAGMTNYHTQAKAILMGGAFASPAPEGWRDIADLPIPKKGEAPWIIVRRTEAFRWLPYKPDGAKQTNATGRWQVSRHAYGGWTNEKPPERSEWRVAPAPHHPARGSLLHATPQPWHSHSRPASGDGRFAPDTYVGSESGTVGSDQTSVTLSCSDLRP